MLAKNMGKGYYNAIKIDTRQIGRVGKEINMFWNLLTSTTSSGAGDPPKNNSGTLVFFVIMIAVIVLFMFWNRQSQKKREKEINDTLDAIQPGSKVKTIGGICGVVVEVCPEDNTFILETGSETSGKSYIKFDKKAVYQTDAKKEVAPVEAVEEMEEAPTQEELFEVAPVETATEEVGEEAPVEETPAEETTEE